MNNENTAIVTFYEDGHDGRGWYYYDVNYADEGSVGAFPTSEEAASFAKRAGYVHVIMK